MQIQAGTICRVTEIMPEPTEFERNCYGMSSREIEVQYLEPNKRFGRMDIAIAGILSDCQEMLGGDNEAVRKQLNIAKYCLFKVFEDMESRK